MSNNLDELFSKKIESGRLPKVTKEDPDFFYVSRQQMPELPLGLAVRDSRGSLRTKCRSFTRWVFATVYRECLSFYIRLKLLVCDSICSLYVLKVKHIYGGGSLLGCGGIKAAMGTEEHGRSTIGFAPY